MASKQNSTDSPNYVKPSKPIITKTPRKTKLKHPSQGAPVHIEIETKHQQAPIVIDTSNIKTIKSIPSTLRDISQLIDDKTQHSFIYAMLHKAYEQAVQGDPVARAYISDRLEGRAVQRQLVQNIDIINKVIGVLERVIVDPLPNSADGLIIAIIYELDKIAKQDEEVLNQ